MQQQAEGDDDASGGLNFGHYGVRLCGQDSERGTFNQRHAAIYDQSTGERWGPPSRFPRWLLGICS